MPEFFNIVVYYLYVRSNVHTQLKVFAILFFHIMRHICKREKKIGSKHFEHQNIYGGMYGPKSTLFSDDLLATVLNYYVTLTTNLFIITV